MIKVPFVLLLLCVVLSCNKRAIVNKTNNVVVANDTISLTTDDVRKGLELVAQQDCFTCHKVDGELTAPSYKRIAQRYPATLSNISMLVGRIQNGVKEGNWGEAMMTPHAGLSTEDATLIVKFILSLKN